MIYFAAFVVGLVVGCAVLMALAKAAIRRSVGRGLNW